MNNGQQTSDNKNINKNMCHYSNGTESSNMKKTVSNNSIFLSHEKLYSKYKNVNIKSHSFKTIHSLTNLNTIKYNKSLERKNIDGDINFFSNQNISYSMIIDKDIEYVKKIKNIKIDDEKKSNNLVKPRKIQHWIDDATECYLCNIKFTFFTRKHHCRYCGRIFCYSCCSNWILIPKYIDLPKNITHWNMTNYLWNYDEEQRVCIKCKKEVNIQVQIKYYMNVFDLLNLTIDDYQNMKKVCKLWNQISNDYLSKFREIQYFLPNHTFSKNEKKILWNNRFLIQSHSKYQLQLIKSIDWLTLTDIDEKWLLTSLLRCIKSYSCWNLMCSRDCKNEITSSDSLELLYPRFNNSTIRKFALHCLSKTPYLELSCYLTFLVHSLRYDIDCLTAKFLIQKAKKNSNFSNDLYWELIMFLPDEDYKHIYKKIINIISFNTKVTSNNQLISMMKSLKQVTNKTEIKHIVEGKISSIVNIDNNIEIKSNDIEIKNSATKPIIIPYSISNSNITNKIMFKYEDIRKDHIILNVIKMMDIILKRENINLNITKYKVIPVDVNCGFIEIVNNAETLYYIKETLNFSIQNYIFEKNNNVSVDRIRRKFMKSCISYCLISYLLGIGDRHLDNIMITDKGYLFHIDFGYILGTDPKLLAPEIRLTVEMIDAMGGSNSKYYKEFQYICSKSYNILRRHTNIFLVLLMSLSEIQPPIDNGFFTEEYITEQVIKRFIPGETYEDAKLQYITKINNNSSTSVFIDYMHYQRKENISKVEDIFKNIGNIFYNYFSQNNFIS